MRNHSRPFHRLGPAVLLAGLLAVAGCGRPPAVAPVEPSDPCAVLPAPETTPDTLAVALLDTVQPSDAPVARNDDEAMVFALLYETLVDLDCNGRVQPALARSWRASQDGRCWTLELRGDARFSDGTAVSAGDVVRSLRTALARETRIDSVGVVDDRHLDVFAGEPFSNVPHVLAAPGWAVAKPAPDRSWPVGTGPYRVREGDARGGRVVLEPVAGSGPCIVFIPGSGGDARDLLDRTELMVTNDPGVVAYAAGAARLVTAALPWSRTYVLVSTARVLAIADGKTAGPGLSPEMREALARDAVRAQARGAADAEWWRSTGACGELSGLPPGLVSAPRADEDGARRIRYPAGDDVARALAERLVALSAMDATASPSAAALAAAVPGIADASRPLAAEATAPGALARSLHDGADYAYVIAVPCHPADACEAGRDLAARAPWLGASRATLGDLLLPLVDTRAHVLAARGRVGARARYSGTLVIAPSATR